jgi:predicted nucleic acid-binding protein
LDTSALAKWYLNERRSEDVAAFLERVGPVVISRLVVLEFRGLLARRRRSREITPQAEDWVWAAFEADVRGGFLDVHALDDVHALAAVQLLEQLRALPLRTLDALHLAIARDLGAVRIATADRIMAAAARALKIEAVRFD